MGQAIITTIVTLVGAVIGTYAGVLFAAKRQEKQ